MSVQKNHADLQDGEQRDEQGGPGRLEGEGRESLEVREVGEGSKNGLAGEVNQPTPANPAEETEAASGETPRLPGSFDHPPLPGRARLLSATTFELIDDFGGLVHGQDILLPLGGQKHLDALAERRTHGRAVKSIDDWKRERAEREAKEEEKRRAKEAEEEAKALEAQRRKADEQLRRLGISGDPAAFRTAMENLPASQRLQIYPLEDVQRLAATAQSPDSDLKKRNEQIAQVLTAKGPWRRIGMPGLRWGGSSSGMVQAVAAAETAEESAEHAAEGAAEGADPVELILALREDHPHFGEVIEFVADHVALQSLAMQNTGHASEALQRPPVRLPPMMLFGPPGVGKTHFCEALAQTLGVPVRRHPMDQAETSSALLGSESTWGNSRFGLVFEILGLGDCANPVVILDELDKARSGSIGALAAPTAVLHSLLEPVSACRVRDISLDLELNASLITWIATANYPWWVPATLRSRMKEFLITLPNAEQAIQLARSVVRNALKAAGAQNPEPDRSFVLALAHLSAREIYQATVSAAAAAVRRGGKQVETSDLPREVLLSAEGESQSQNWLH